MTDRTTDINYPVYIPVTIPSGAAVPTAGVDIGNCTLVGIITPAEFDGTTITFTAAATLDGTYYTVAANNTASTAYTITTTNSIFTPVTVNIVPMGLRFIKPTCGTNQTGDTILVLVVRRIH